MTAAVEPGTPSGHPSPGRPAERPAERPADAPPQTPATFPHLDALRAIGALAVLTTHVAFWSGRYSQDGTLGVLLARLDVGVALFFVLSGFLLSRAWLVAADEGTRRPGTGHYLWKRALRIVPLYLVAATAALLLVEDAVALPWQDKLATYLLASTLVEPSFPAGLTHMWSLAVEVHFYLLLPLLMLLAVGRSRLRPARVVLVLAAMVAVTVWWTVDGAPRVGRAGDGDLGTAQWLPGYLAWFAVGIGLALAQLLHARGAGGRAVAALVRLGAQPGVCWAAAAGLLLVSATPIAGPALLAAPTDAEALTKALLYAAIGGLLVVPAVLRPEPVAGAAPSAFDRLLTHRAARHLGWISYGVFALHLPLLHLVMHLTGWELFRVDFLPLWGLTLLVSLLAAELAYRLVERPALRLKGFHPLARRRGRSAASRSTASTGTSAR